MAVSPADFELYSRATGAPIPRDPQERMRMAPEVYNFSRNFAREPSGFRKAAGVLGRAAQLGGALAGAYGIAKALGPEAGEIVSQVANEVVKENKGPSEVVITDLRTPKEPHIRKGNYSGNRRGNYGKELPPSEVVVTDLTTPEEKYIRRGNYSGNKSGNYGKQVGTVGSLQGGQDAGPEFSITEEQANAMSPSELSAAYSNLSNATSDPNLKEIYKRSADRNTSRIEQPTGEIVVVDEPQPAITTTQQDPRGFLGDFAKGAISKAQEEVNAFDAGVDWGDTLDQAASAGSPVEGAFILGGSVAKKGFHDTKTRIGKDINTAGNIVSEAVANVKKIPAAMQEVDSVIANEQMKASVMPDNKMQETTGNILIDQASSAPNKTIHTGGSIQGSEPGLGAQVDSGSPQTNRRREELRETFRKSLGTVSPEKREALIDQQLEKESNSKGLSQLKNFVSKAMSSDIAQAGDQAAKKVVRGILRTVAGEEKFQEMAAENLREQQAERMRAMAGNEARMSNIRSKYSMDYNPAAPKLAGDEIIGLNKDRFGSSAYIPTGGIDMLRDKSLPASAYDVKVPREDEETPLWWEV